ncbi:Receptor-like serine/threonine-protein kinase ALE2 [Heracleum sosnowskyi]|uniref:Receptor-like serine/threonine-protein kinase ALE2 n=1 Tax=Heracleum sosnowskyi TaxID=360622 RepID=A0AAD8H8F6_9APIA|nr:Receptor-like serine/threonine-protein kinase ALE2 [Heracleum sosnowskyi]
MQFFLMVIICFMIFNACPVIGFAGFKIPAFVLNHLSTGRPHTISHGTISLSHTFLQNDLRENKNAGPFRSPSSIAPTTQSFHRHANKPELDSAPLPSQTFFKHHHIRKNFKDLAPGKSYQLQPPTNSQQGPSVSPFDSTSTPTRSWSAISPSQSSTISSYRHKISTTSPTVSPLSSSMKKKKILPPPTVLALPPPPPSEGCASVTCTVPLTYTPGGAPCNCVWPIEVRLGLSVSLYVFFPLVSELAKEIATGLSLNQSQVRIMGANAAVQQPEKTMVLINLVPLIENFDNDSAFMIYTMFWMRKVHLKASLFGGSKVIHVSYPGLPPSPPSVHSSAANIDDHEYPHNENDGMPEKPLGVDVSRARKGGTDGSLIAVIVLSSATAFIVCMGVVWFMLVKCGCSICQTNQTDVVSSRSKPSGTTKSLMYGSRPSSASMSYSSSILAYTGTAKIFSLTDMQRATDSFDASRIIGEGGFGLVYSGILDDRREVAVKVLKRDDQQGGREFLAEVEMLSRLHHRNLVTLIGICTDDQYRCLVYELVPNGSVESHLHGSDKESAPLDWSARMKIALGSARGLAYLHEDSSPRVIHRDFKASNILLEHDYTPKVSDFGLAKTALDGENRHISTHVMGTFGYLAPEYAMTGHLLVKSDVYSYGVVLLELLTGRKPVDLSQPPGQENLVAWARPLLTSKESLETLIDHTFKQNIPLDSVSKVAAIASMCVQPEVSHRPFMGEVVQALKLVCNEFDEIKDSITRSSSHEDFLIDMHNEHTTELMEVEGIHDLMSSYDPILDSKIPMSATDLRYASAGIEEQDSISFRRISNSAPLEMVKKKKLWQR